MLSKKETFRKKQTYRYKLEQQEYHEGHKISKKFLEECWQVSLCSIPQKDPDINQTDNLWGFHGKTRE
jgi:hypothetical protein